MRKVDVLTVKDPRRLGSLIDPGDGADPYGTTEEIDQMLHADRRAKFDYYAAGWSNGYVQTRIVG